MIYPEFLRRVYDLSKNLHEEWKNEQSQEKTRSIQIFIEDEMKTEEIALGVIRSQFWKFTRRDQTIIQTMSELIDLLSRNDLKTLEDFSKEVLIYELKDIGSLVHKQINCIKKDNKNPQ